MGNAFFVFDDSYPDIFTITVSTTSGIWRPWPNTNAAGRIATTPTGGGECLVAVGTNIYVIGGKVSKK